MSAYTPTNISLHPPVLLLLLLLLLPLLLLLLLPALLSSLLSCHMVGCAPTRANLTPAESGESPATGCSQLPNKENKPEITSTLTKDCFDWKSAHSRFTYNKKIYIVKEIFQLKSIGGSVLWVEARRLGGRKRPALSREGAGGGSGADLPHPRASTPR